MGKIYSCSKQQLDLFAYNHISNRSNDLFFDLRTSFIMIFVDICRTHKDFYCSIWVNQHCKFFILLELSQNRRYSCWPSSQVEDRSLESTNGYQLVNLLHYAMSQYNLKILDLRSQISHFVKWQHRQKKAWVWLKN